MVGFPKNERRGTVGGHQEQGSKTLMMPYSNYPIGNT
jgi:hypothetical protein